MVSRGIGYKDGSGNYGFRMTESGSICLGNDSTDSIQVSGTLDVSGSVDISGGLTVDTSTLHVDTTNNRVGINTTSPSASLTISGDADDGIVSLRLGANQNAGVSNYSARIEMAEDTNNDQVMNYGAFFDYDGDAVSPDLGMLKIGMRDNSTTDKDIVKISRKADADALVLGDTSAHVTVSGEIGLTSSGGSITLYADGNDINLKGTVIIPSTYELDVDCTASFDGPVSFGKDVIFSDTNGTFPTATPGFYWQLNNDEARMYARQPASDQIDFVFKLSDNNNSVDRYLFWIDDYRGGSYDRYPILAEGGNVLFHMTQTSEGVPNTGTAKFRINSAGTTVIGQQAIDTDEGMVQIKQSADDHNGGGLTIIQSATSDAWTIWQSTAENLNFSFNGSSKGYLNDSTNVSNIDFTGQHRCTPSTSTTYSALSSSVGKIVVSDGTYSNLSNSGISVNEAIPKVKLSNARNQKSAFGIISDAEDENSTTREYTNGIYTSLAEKTDASDNRIYINSLGEGGIWITNINGNLENGDYITTCEIPGYGMKQDDDLLHNYTVAKITQDCDFDLNSSSYECVEVQHSGSTYRAAFVGCTYHCG